MVGGSVLLKVEELSSLMGDLSAQWQQHGRPEVRACDAATHGVLNGACTAVPHSMRLHCVCQLLETGKNRKKHAHGPHEQ